MICMNYYSSLSWYSFLSYLSSDYILFFFFVSSSFFLSLFIIDNLSFDCLNEFISCFFVSCRSCYSNYCMYFSSICLRYSSLSKSGSLLFLRDSLPPTAPLLSRLPNYYDSTFVFSFLG